MSIFSSLFKSSYLFNFRGLTNGIDIFFHESTMRWGTLTIHFNSAKTIFVGESVNK